MRRSGVDEAISGGIMPRLSSKMANTLSESNRLYQTYVLVNLEAVRDADDARTRTRDQARRRRIKRTNRDEKVATAQGPTVATRKPETRNRLSA
jgi:hypothetical protein